MPRCAVHDDKNGRRLVTHVVYLVYTYVYRHGLVDVRFDIVRAMCCYYFVKNRSRTRVYIYTSTRKHGMYTRTSKSDHPCDNTRRPTITAEKRIWYTIFTTAPDHTARWLLCRCRRHRVVLQQSTCPIITYTSNPAYSEVIRFHVLTLACVRAHRLILFCCCNLRDYGCVRKIYKYCSRDEPRIT